MKHHEVSSSHIQVMCRLFLMAIWGEKWTYGIVRDLVSFCIEFLYHSSWYICNLCCLWFAELTFLVFVDAPCEAFGFTPALKALTTPLNTLQKSVLYIHLNMKSKKECQLRSSSHVQSNYAWLWFTQICSQFRKSVTCIKNVVFELLVLHSEIIHVRFV